MADEQPEPVVSTGIMAYDLTDAQAAMKKSFSSLLPLSTPMPGNPLSRENFARLDRERREREARVVEETLLATARWRDLRLALRRVGNKVGDAVLYVHQPIAGYDSVVCCECMASDDDDTVPAPWECATFKAVAKAAGVAGD